MSILELEERIKNASVEDKQNIVNSISIEECIQILNGENFEVKYIVINRKKYSITEIEYLIGKIDDFDLQDIIEKFNVKTKEDLKKILSFDITQKVKDNILYSKIYSLSNEDLTDFIDNYEAADKNLRRIYDSSRISESSKLYLIRNSRYGSYFAQYYLKGIEYDLSLETNEMYNICLEKISESLNMNKEEMKYYISILGQNNPYIFQTIDYKMLTPEFRELYTLNYNKSISNTDKLFVYYSIQNSITSFGNSPEKIEVLKELFEYTNNNYTDNWEAYVYLITSSFESNKDFYDSLKLNAAGKVFNNSDIEKLMAYCSISDREYKLSNISDIINLDKVRSEYIASIFNNPLADGRDMKNALLEKKYGINFEYASALVYEFNIDGINIDPSIAEMFGDIKNILQMNNQELRNREKETELGEMINIIDLQKKLKNAFEQEYEKQLFKPAEDNYMRTEDGIKIYNAGVDFAMITHSVGAIHSKTSEDISDYEHWNRKSMGLDCFSASFIRNDSLSFCTIDKTIYGFSTLEEDWLLDMKDSDYASAPTFANGLDSSIIADRGHLPGNRMVPDEMVKTTGNRSAYNEFVIKKHNNGETRKPDYIVFVCDDFKKDIDSDEIITGGKESGKIAYQNTLKAAKEFNIPIVVIERNKVLINEKAKIDEAKEKLFNLEEQIDEKQIKECVDNIITRYRTNFLSMGFGDRTKTTEKYKNTGISIDNYVKDCNSVLEYARYLEPIDEQLSKTILKSFKDAIIHPRKICQLAYGIDDEIMKKYEGITHNTDELETNKNKQLNV